MKFAQVFLASICGCQPVQHSRCASAWVMVARAVAGRVERMTNKPANGTATMSPLWCWRPTRQGVRHRSESLQARTDLTITSNDAKSAKLSSPRATRWPACRPLLWRQALPVGGRL